MSIEEQKAAQAVAWAIQLADGSISPYGWSDMRTFVAAQKYMVLDDGCMFVFAYRIPYAHEDVMRMVEAAQRANGEHVAPYDCYSTGPLTGDVMRDLVSCPGCELIGAFAPFTHQAKDGSR